ncbi:MAG: DUF1016 N-terminal domain-containing protein [Candidatus Brocadia sp.]|nr:DUF1016 N-terminal domain-containing protein [Candidatus Brocadia sp.]
MSKTDKANKAKGLIPGDYASLLAEVKERVRFAQYTALKAVNRELVALYWDIGRLIISRQADAAHGSAIAEQLASDLRTEFPGVGGFSRRNIFYMREFYITYHNQPKVQQLVATYQMVKRLPKELKGQLPGPEEIAKLLEDGERG